MWHDIRRKAGLLVVLLLLAGCSEPTGNDQLPPDVQGPEDALTPEGALAAYFGVRDAFREAFAGTGSGVVVGGALITDEFGNYWTSVFINKPMGLDSRFLLGVDAAYASLHRVRGGAREAIGLLGTYAPELPSALRAHVYALEGYAEVLLADLYCSGIPLSTVDFGGDYTLRPGSTTAEVYQHAVALFDSALALAGDTARFLHLAQVGKGRALLALGRFAEASQAVATVPDGFSYTVQHDAGRPNFMRLFDPNVSSIAPGTMTDREGANGLDYLSSSDPRVAWVHEGNQNGYPIYRPAKYDMEGTGSIVVADWVEARLIEAEAALNAGDVSTWLDKLNHLRQTAWPTIVPATDGPLANLTDPGTDAARLDVTFRERAFWLFLTGHRQGDLRRLIRQYGRDPETVYAIGFYPGSQGSYGPDIVIPVPVQEQSVNPLYAGCFNQGA